MPASSECVFCKIVAGEIPGSVVFENRSAVAILDINPIADGHLLVIPREHYGQITEMPPEASADLFSTLPSLGRAVMEVTGATGFNVLQSNGQVAGQIVSHVHIHIIPRHPVDDLGFRWHPTKYEAGRAAELKTAYDRALSSAN